MKLNFSVGMGRKLNAAEAAAHARAAEEFGFSHLTWVDQPNLSRDPYICLTVAALNTHRIQLGQGVTDPLTYHPAVIANATATLNELTGGRAFVGLGAGGPYGKAMKPLPVSELREAVRFIRGYMAGEEMEWKGARMHSEWSRKPVPVYLAVDGPQACRLAGEVADGAIFIGVHPEAVKWRLELVQEGARAAGRDPAAIDTWARCMVYVSDTKEAAHREVRSYPTAYTKLHTFFDRDSPEIRGLRQRLEAVEPGLVHELVAGSARAAEAYDPYFHEHVDAPHCRFVTQKMIDYFHFTGPAEEICRRIETVARLGVRTISATVFTVLNKKRVMERISEEIMPAFRQ